MTVRDEDFNNWLDELVQVFITGYGLSEQDAKIHVHSNRSDWKYYFDDGYTPRTAASEDANCGA